MTAPDVFMVIAQNFAGTNTLPFVLVAAVLLLLILLPAAKRMGAGEASRQVAPPSAPAGAGK